MAPDRIVIDALWRCLNPSIDSKLFVKVLQTPLPVRRAVRPSRHHGLCRSLGTGQVRALHAAAPLKTQSPQRLSSAVAQRARVDPGSRPHPDPDPEPSPSISELLGSALPVPESTLSRIATPALYEALRALRHHSGQGAKIRQLAEYLVAQRGEPPNVFLYEALVTANWDTTTGSAAELRDMLREMRAAGVSPSPGFYHSALRLLAIHPDYLTRNSILSDMQAREMELTDDGKCSVALGLLRDPQVEMALEYLDQMCRERAEIPDWVFEIFFYALGQQGFLDEALELLRQRLRSADDRDTAVPLAVWHFLLEEFSSGLHHEGTRFVWERMVQTRILNPSDGVALCVQYTASRHGDSALATEVTQLLSARGVKLAIHHYEALLDCYVEKGELENAFEVLHIMTEAGLQPDQGSTRSIYLALRKSPALVDTALDILSALRKRHEIPVSAVNVVVEALALSGDMDRALEAYRQLNQLCPSGPNQETFVVLLQGAENDQETRSFLEAEMQRFSIRLPPGTLDPLGRPL